MLLTALSVVDDTALLKKFVVGELQVGRMGHLVPYCSFPLVRSNG